MVRRVDTWRWAALVACGCAVGDNDEGNAGVLTYPPMSAPMTMTSASGSGSGSSTDAEIGDTDSEPSTAGDGSTTGDTGPTASSDGTAVTDTGEPLPPQPDNGMYSDCLSAAMCVGLNTCITILDTQSMPIDGFCTNNACMAPQRECEPSPGGTAVPFCMPVTLNGNADTVCALDCSGGKTCPGGMMCWELGRTSVCA